jgi:predicted N-formylglutamate amidohydrolase
MTLGAGADRRWRLLFSSRHNPALMNDRLVLTCEHAGNVVPAQYAPLFVGHEHLLPTHRGWDPGALLLAREMADRFAAPLYFDETTRLLADLNRSVGSRELHSEATRHLTLRERRALLEAHYHPHRRRVDAAMASAVATGDRVVHIASHSFTPELNGHVRSADIGMLYDPGRPGEVAFASAWLDALRRADPTLRLRRNYPYIGKSDGVTQVMRRKYPPERYVGIELEVNQRYVEAGGPAWPKLRKTLVDTLATALQVRGGTAPDVG